MSLRAQRSNLRMAPTEASVHVFPDASAVAGAAAGLVAEAIEKGVRREGRAIIALSGGSTPEETYRRLAAHGEIDWSLVHVCQVDERCVPPDDELSNWRMINETLIAPAGVPAAHAHRMEGERPPPAAARDYEAVLRRLFPTGAPAFDAVVLGIGEDGHVASLFRGSPALAEQTRWVLHTESPPSSPVSDRLTLTLPALGSARFAVFVVTGANKGSAVKRALSASGGTPAGMVRPAGRLAWVLDEAAGGAVNR